MVLAPDLNYHIYADNFFSSLTLVDHLTQLNIGYTGTIQENRLQKCSVEASKELAKHKRGESDYCMDTAYACLLPSGAIMLLFQLLVTVMVFNQSAAQQGGLQKRKKKLQLLFQI